MLPDHDPYSVTIGTMPLSDGGTLYYTGAPLSAGPLPAIFYFCSTGEESLGQDPYNQPVTYVSEYPLRVFSLSLPYHDEATDRRQAVDLWAQALQQGIDPLTPYLQQVVDAIAEVVAKGLAPSGKIAVAGLSRGGWIATHAAARSPHVKAVAAFAPLTDLLVLDEFKSLHDNPVVQAMSLNNVIDSLVGKPLRYYIGNRDTRVGTDNCYAFVRRLAEHSYSQQFRSPPVEFIVSPSVGHLGHGTTTRAFHSGAQWLLNILGLSEKEGGYP